MVIGSLINAPPTFYFYATATILTQIRPHFQLSVNPLHGCPVKYCVPPVFVSVFFTHAVACIDPLVHPGLVDTPGITEAVLLPPLSSPVLAESTSALPNLI